MYNNYGMMNGMNNMMGGSVYGKATPIKIVNPLTTDELALLNSSRSTGFSMKVSKEDIAKAVCTHKDPKTGQSAAMIQPDGSFKCYICGESFNLVENPEMVDHIIAETLNILQSCKAYYVDIPENVAREFFKIIPLIKQIPALYRTALNHFNQYDNQGMIGNGANVNAFAAYSAMAGGMNQIGMPMGGMNMGMPSMDPTMMNGMGMQQPMMNGMGMQQPMMNGMQPQMGAMPMMGGATGPMVTDPYGANVNMTNNQMGMVQQPAQATNYNPFVNNGGAGYAPNAQTTASAVQDNNNASTTTMPAGMNTVLPTAEGSTTNTVTQVKSAQV